MKFAGFLIKNGLLSFASFLEAVILSFYEKLSRPKINSNKSILIIQLGQIGDFIITKALFHSLKKRYGESFKLSVLIDPINEKLAKNDPYIDAVYFYNSPKYSRKLEKKYSFPELELKKNRFDVAIWLRGDLITFLWLLRNRIPLKSITKFSNPLRWSWLSFIMRRRTKGNFLHYIQQLNLLNEGVEDAYNEMQLQYISLKHSSYQKIVFLHVSAGNGIRVWPEDNYSAVCRMLVELDRNISIRLIGSEIDNDVAERIKNIAVKRIGSENRIINLCGQVDLAELDKILAGGDLFIGFDSGPMHIAALCGIPVIALMGPQSPQLFRPWGSQCIKIIYKDFYCSPCWQFKCYFVDSGAGACILAIAPSEVVNEARKILLGKEYYGG